MNDLDRIKVVTEARAQMVPILSSYDMDIGMEAMIQLLAGACTAVDGPRQLPLLQLVTKGIRAHYKDLRNVQLEKTGEARRSRELSEQHDRGDAEGDLRPPETDGQADGSDQGVQPNPPGDV